MTTATRLDEDLSVFQFSHTLTFELTLLCGTISVVTAARLGVGQLVLFRLRSALALNLILSCGTIECDGCDNRNLRPVRQALRRWSGESMVAVFE
eukprot:COSAG01_NODE_679_length_14296_cov_250.437575_6_plen_95_part_00